MISATVMVAGAFTGVASLVTAAPALAANQSTSGSGVVGWGADFSNTNTNTIFTYVKAGETVRATASNISPIASTFTFIDETGVTRALATDHVAVADGVWIFTAGPSGQTGNRSYNWDVTVTSGGSAVAGRTWLNKNNVSNQSTSPQLQYWAVNDVGYVYKVDLMNYNGIYSSIQASSVGNPVSAAECSVPRYSSEMTSAVVGGCGATYRLFVESPSADLPAVAQSALGELIVKPAALTPDDLVVTDLAFASTAPSSAAGAFTWTMPSRFSGSYTLDIDVDNNGSYTDPVDRSIPLGADGTELEARYAFDGIDGLGAAIGDCQILTARVHYDKLGEIHIRQEDVEGRSGITITRLDGPGAPSNTIYWNDTNLNPATSANTTPVVDGRAGVDSSAANVHGWDFNDNSWGNNRSIDDWTYAPADTTGQEISFGGNCLTLAKSSSAVGPVHAGDTIDYTITVTNSGQADYTVDAPARIEDDLAGVLDDASYNDDATNGAVVTDGVLSWSGALSAGESTTINYSVTVNSPRSGDGVLGNTVIDPDGLGSCETEGGCTTNDLLQSYTVAKSASTATVNPGGTVNYTIAVTNTGLVDYTSDAPASFVDDLSEVLDDANYNDDASNGAVVTGSELAWSGALAVGETVEISYSVTVKSPVSGDLELRNAVVPNAEIGGSCDPEAECETLAKVSSYDLAKTVSDKTAVAGDVVSYTIAITNTGLVPFTDESPATFTDDLSDVLDEASYNNDATGGATYAAPTLSWSGALNLGETVTVTYSVTVRAGVTEGTLRNVVVVPESSGSLCVTGSETPKCQTATTIDGPPVVGPPPSTPADAGLANTGVDPAQLAALAALLLALGAGGFVVTRSRRFTLN